jgi:hypothetical protein
MFHPLQASPKDLAKDEEALQKMLASCIDPRLPSAAQVSAGLHMSDGVDGITTPAAPWAILEKQLSVAQRRLLTAALTVASPC